MEVLVLLVIVVVVVLWASTKRKTRRQSVQPVETNIPDPEVIVTVRTSPSGSFDDPDTGSIIPAQHGGWILNPKSTFPLTVYGIDQSTANECKRLLDEGYSKGTYGHARSLLPIIARSNLRCREIDEYVATHKPRYLKKIAELKRSSSDWASASERDQEDLLETFREEAIESLDVRPYCDLVTLFEGEPADITLDDALIDRFGVDTLQLYLRYAGNLEKVHVIPANHYDRSGFEKLVESGLAIRGQEISLAGILERLKLKDMKELAKDLNPPVFRKKTQAVEFLVNLPDIRERISKVVGFRELFQLRALPSWFSEIDLSDISASWRYASEIGTIIAHTYVAAGYATRGGDQYRGDMSYITGWELLTANDDSACPNCKRMATRTYSRNRYPKVPLHIGCRCTVSPKFRD